MSTKPDLVIQMILTLLSFFLVAVALRADPVLNARWITAASSVGVLVTMFSISYYLWCISHHLDHLCKMLSGEREMHSSFKGTMERLIKITQTLGQIE